MDYETFFTQATAGLKPFDFQRRIAADGLPNVVQVPMGAGKTEAAVLGWLYRLLFHPDPQVRADTPRRLVYALPMRALIEQTEQRVQAMLANLDLADPINVHVLMGGRLLTQEQNQWRTLLDRPTIVLGTIDCIVSRMLLRGYGTNRPAYPLDFSLLTNGSQVVLDEVQLCEQATTTVRQIVGMTRRWHTAEPMRLMCMSATVDTTVLDTVDNQLSDADAPLELSQADKQPDTVLGKRFNATRLFTHLSDVKSAADVARQALETHKPGTVTLVILNTVEAAVEVYRKLSKAVAIPAVPTVKIELLHSRFRGTDRYNKVQQLLMGETPRDGRIVVATQVVEAGLDLDAHTLITEAAPWSSVCQRTGRCNRRATMRDAQVLWFEPWDFNKQPYDEADIKAAVKQLHQFTGKAVNSSDLLERPISPANRNLRIIRASDVLSLFDTSTDLAGHDLDVAMYIREKEPLDMSVAWVDEEDSPDRAGAANLPPEALRCPASLSAVKKLLTRLKNSGKPQAWIQSPHQDKWKSATTSDRLTPGTVLLVASAAGGYDQQEGFSPTSTTPVPSVEQPSIPLPAAIAVDAPLAGEEPGSINQRSWELLSDHLTLTHEHAVELTQALKPDLAPDVVHALVVAAYVHDLGKAFPDWQAALLNTRPDDSPGEGVWAKSPTLPSVTTQAEQVAASIPRRRLQVMRTVNLHPVHNANVDGQHCLQVARGVFRHELVTVLMLGTPTGAELLRTLGVAQHRHNLCRYLAGAHHGVLRLQLFDPNRDGLNGESLLGVWDGEELPTYDWPHVMTVGGGHADLDDLATGSNGWTEQALQLLEEFGPFRLAYMETLVRMADWRASAHLPVADQASRHNAEVVA